jgi:hypothetical protein
MVGSIHLAVSIHSCGVQVLCWSLAVVVSRRNLPGQQGRGTYKSMETAFLTNRLKSYNPPKNFGA